MGLDMYLHAKKYVEKIEWSKLDRDNDLGLDSPEVVNPLWNDIVNISGMSDVATDIYGVHVEVTCAYWRKANQIHAWFVKNVQGGNDNCGEYYVSHEKLKELLTTCQQALFSKDPSLLPPQEGFFFGGTDIDEWYWQDIKDTIKKLKRVLVPEMSKLSFYYTSSW
ncbi:MAG: hypothetical protein EBW14_01700 [Oxalobacteraceae bacterium]|jgi:hypothetical protein|nr:hypothetical protein [Oxalobacteraceae bacterium]